LRNPRLATNVTGAGPCAAAVSLLLAVRCKPKAGGGGLGLPDSLLGAASGCSGLGRPRSSGLGTAKGPEARRCTRRTPGSSLSS
jgi:hypothetical protein